MLTVTATELPRIMACNGSRLMGGGLPPIDPDDTIRNEGNAAHWLVQQVYSGNHTAEELIDRKAPNGVYITVEMVEHLEDYFASMPGSWIEVDTSHSSNNFSGHDYWHISGRADRITYDRVQYHLIVADLKYGWGIVEPENNWTLISNAIGFIINNPKYEVKKISFVIYQPRPHHPAGRTREVTITVEELFELHKQIDAIMSYPSDILNTGPNCYKCPALATCPAARKAQMNAIDASETAFNDNIDNDNLSFQLDHLKRALEVLEQSKKAYDELAKHRIRDGQIVKNYSLENELTNRVWKDIVSPELVQVMTGKDLTKKQLITPTQMEKQGISPDVVHVWTERRNKGIKLVRVDANAKAKKIFGDRSK